MPMISKAQRGAMHAAAADKSTLGIPKSVGAEFVKSDKGGSLPDYARPKANRRDYPKYAGGGSVVDDPSTYIQNPGTYGNVYAPSGGKAEDSMTKGEWLAMVPGNPALGSLANTPQAIRRWKKLSPNG